MAGQELPIFELPLVLLPGERIPLHIFEDRYKRMLARSIDEGEPFGVVLHDDDGARSIGCTARVDEVVERFDDGRLNVLVSGQSPFKVLDRFEAPDYPAAEVELLTEEDLAGDPETADDAREVFAELAQRATGERPDEAELEREDAYGIAGKIELPPDTKQRLLESRDEQERMELLANALKAVEAALDRVEDAAEHAKSNGKVRFDQLGG